MSKKKEIDPSTEIEKQIVDLKEKIEHSTEELKAPPPKPENQTMIPLFNDFMAAKDFKVKEELLLCLNHTVAELDARYHPNRATLVDYFPNVNLNTVTKLEQVFRETGWNCKAIIVGGKVCLSFH